MSLPTLSKTWSFDVNNSQVSGTSLGKSQECLFTIKSAMLTLGSNPWTVVSSSDSSTADSNDNWGVATDLVWDIAGNAHSWIVLKQTGMATNFQICFDLNNTSDLSMAVIVSHTAGFTGGSTTARPTATDEYVIKDGTWGRGNASGTTNTPVHIMISSDGEATRVLFNKANNVTGYWDFQKLSGPSTGWSTPYVLTFSGQSTSSAADYTNIRDALGSSSKTEVQIIAPNPSERIVACRYCSEGYKGDSYGTLITVANEISNAWELMPAGVFCDLSPNKGRHGSLYDAWFISTGLTTGDTMPADSSHQFAVFDDMCFPWNGTLPVTT